LGDFNFGAGELLATRSEEVGDVVDRLIWRALVSIALGRIRPLRRERAPKARAGRRALIFVLVAVMAALVHFAEGWLAECARARTAATRSADLFHQLWRNFFQET